MYRALTWWALERGVDVADDATRPEVGRPRAARCRSRSRCRRRDAVGHGRRARRDGGHPGAADLRRGQRGRDQPRRADRAGAPPAGDRRRRAASSSRAATSPRSSRRTPTCGCCSPRDESARLDPPRPRGARRRGRRRARRDPRPRGAPRRAGLDRGDLHRGGRRRDRARLVGADLRRDGRGLLGLVRPPGPAPRDRRRAAGRRTPTRDRCRCWPSSVGPTSASRRWSTGSSAAARRSSRTCRASPGTGCPTTRRGTGAASPSSTPAAGSRTPRACRPRSPRRPSWRSRPPTRCSSWSTRRSARPTPTRPSSGCCAGPASRSSWSPTRSTATGSRPTRQRCGRWASASRTRCRRCTGAAAATCSTRCWPRCPRRRRSGSTTRAARAGWRCSAGPTSASPRCSTSWRARTGSSSTRSPAPPATRSTS